MPNQREVPLLRHAVTPVHGRYLVRPAVSMAGDLWLVGFHGQRQTADICMDDLDRVALSGRWLRAAVQGLHRHYVGRKQAVAATWMTSQDREMAIADNVAWVDTVLDRMAAEFGAPRAIVFSGFSQGVAMAYRAAMLGRREAAGIVACCGDVPPELRDRAPRAWPRVLTATGSTDAWYDAARLEADADRLRRAGCDVRTLVFDGGHEWTDALCEAIGALGTEIERSHLG